MPPTIPIPTNDHLCLGTGIRPKPTTLPTPETHLGIMNPCLLDPSQGRDPRLTSIPPALSVWEKVLSISHRHLKFDCISNTILYQHRDCDNMHKTYIKSNKKNKQTKTITNVAWRRGRGHKVPTLSKKLFAIHFCWERDYLFSSVQWHCVYHSNSKASLMLRKSWPTQNAPCVFCVLCFCWSLMGVEGRHICKGKDYD